MTKNDSTMTRYDSVNRLCTARRFVPIIMLLSALGCDSQEVTDDERDTIDSPLVGSWAASSVLVNGVDQVPVGLTLDLFFDEFGTYDIFAGGDSAGLVCDDGQPTCQVTGDYILDSGNLVLDPATPDQITLDYTIGVDRLVLVGVLDGEAVTATFERRETG